MVATNPMIPITELPEDTNLNEAADDFGGAIACLFVDFLRKFKLKDTETLDKESLMK